MQDTTKFGTTPEPAPTAADPDAARYVTLHFETTQEDPELQAIEAMLVLLQLLPYDTRVRALRYVRDRVETDPNVWGEHRPKPSPARPLASPGDVAKVLAEADGCDWEGMSTIQRGAYFRRADTLLSRMVVETK
jgi:hypothetical protein